MYSCTLLPTLKVIPSNSLNNINSQTACFAKIVEKCTQKRNYAVSLQKYLGTSCHHTSLTFYETIYTSELYQNVKIHEHSPIC